jgi:hypothetical protein
MRTIAVGLVALLAVAGCSSDSKSTASGSSASTNTASTSSAASTSGPTTTFKSAFVGTGDVFFLSPSKNIGCALSDTAVRCDIRDRSWQPPPKPASCDVDFGQGITIVGTSPASFTCAGDTVLVGDSVLDYGSLVRRGDFECRSETSAMSCRNVKSGHSFSLAKEKFTLG